MKRIFEKYRGCIVRISADVVGVLVGYTDDQFIMLLEEGCEPSYCFSLDELEKKDYYIDNSFEIEGETCYYSYCLENNIISK